MATLFNALRARQWMRMANVDALVASSPVNVKYFCGYSCWLDPLFKRYMMRPGDSSDLAQRCFAVFPPEGAISLIVKSLMAANAVDLEGIDLRPYGDPGLDLSLPAKVRREEERPLFVRLGEAKDLGSAVEALSAALMNLGLAKATIGTEMEGLSEAERHALAQSLPQTRFKDCTNLIRVIRSVKTDMEIGFLTRAAEIAEQAADKCLSAARVGTLGHDVVEQFRLGVARSGATYDHFSFSLRGFGICSDIEYHFQHDDVLYIDFGCICNGYFSDSGTTLAFSELPPELARRRTLLENCVAAGADALRPGTKASSIQLAMQQVLRAGRITASFPHGHGLGLEVRDYPILVPATGLPIRDECISVDSDLEMEEGMVINLEAPLFMGAVGALQVEKTFLVTARGCRPLAAQDRSRPYTAAPEQPLSSEA